MDLRAYYQQLRETEASIPAECVLVISNATADGGKAGVQTEVRRPVAARLIVDGRARLATAEENARYRAQLRDFKRRADEAASAARLQVTMISAAELHSLRERTRPSKG